MAMASGSSSEKFTVVLAVDQSEYSQYTFKWYLKNVHQPAHDLHLVHVPEYWGHLGRVIPPTKIHELVEQTRALTEKLKTNYLQWAAQNGVGDAKFAHPHGHEAWHEIIKYAEKVGARLIVIGNRGQGVLRRTFLGSVSDSVLHHSHVPVLVCRSKDTTNSV